VAEGNIPRTVPKRFSADETLDVGEDFGTPVTRDYEVPFIFQGKIEMVTVDLKTIPPFAGKRAGYRSIG
jgi:arylsulfatase